MLRTVQVQQVSIHAPVRGATLSECSVSRIDNVSIHAPVRGATTATACGRGARPFQSTPPYEGRLSRPVMRRGLRSVSIHAPVRGATVLRYSRGQFPVVSIHAPVRGATADDFVYAVLKTFQSTPPYEGRPLIGALFIVGGYGFNPRPRTRGDDNKPHIIHSSKVSIHAPVRGATPATPCPADISMFQSTPPYEGRLRFAIACARISCVSIHAPVRGAT